MQASAPPPMTQDVYDQLVLALAPLLQTVNPPSGGWRRGVKESDRQAVTAQVNLIQQRLNADIDLVKVNLQAHDPDIQQLVDMAKAEMNLAKKTVQAYEKLQDDESLDQAVHITALVANQLKTIATGTITKKNQDEAASWLADLDATVKSYRNQVKTMETVLETGLKAFTPKQIKSHKKIFDAAVIHVTHAEAIHVEAEELVVAAKEHMRVIKRVRF